jgi:hypothetical protein
MGMKARPLLMIVLGSLCFEGKCKVHKGAKHNQNVLLY